MPDGERLRAIILTAIPVEYKAVRLHVTHIRQELHPSGTVYERGNFPFQNPVWDVLIVECGSGNARATAETVRAIEYFKPQVALFVGVAGGLKDVKLGDVVAATKVYGFESGKTGETFQPRPEVRSSTHSMEQRARAEAKKDDWLQRLNEVPISKPQIYVAPIASGSQVVASTDSTVLQLIRSNYSDAVAIEMEGYGFLEAVHAYPAIKALIIRGISDLIDDKFEADAQKFQEPASRNASAFAFELLAKLSENVPNQKLLEQLSDASQKPGEATVNQRAVAKSHFNALLVSIPSYIEQVELLRNFLDEGRSLSPGWCKNAIKWLDAIDDHIQLVREKADMLDPLERAILLSVHEKITLLIRELQKFRQLPWLISASYRKRTNEAAYIRIHSLARELLADLRRFTQ